MPPYPLKEMSFYIIKKSNREKSFSKNNTFLVIITILFFQKQ
ncbi:hypothetical protein N207_07640 [Helicobacter pylori UM114]|uniref:Uncharacterized protein n=1 Tax=Helicobacter pylori UM114 TaxID=1355531 RepID=T0ETW1_HELPX|nr:hypothetical protein N207_07640 [Helicobacter pylori UM114]